jgi:excisionase family DNA binding protein
MSRQKVINPLAITPREAFVRLGISEFLGWRMIKEGKIPCVKLGVKRLLVPVAALEKLLQTGGERQ